MCLFETFHRTNPGHRVYFLISCDECFVKTDPNEILSPTRFEEVILYYRRRLVYLFRTNIKPNICPSLKLIAK